MVVELVHDERPRCPRLLQRQRVDRAHRPGASGSEDQRAAVGRDVTSPLVLRRHEQGLGRARAVGGNPIEVTLAELAESLLMAPEDTMRLPSGVQMGRWPAWSKVR